MVKGGKKPMRGKHYILGTQSTDNSQSNKLKKKTREDKKEGYMKKLFHLDGTSASSKLTKES